MTAADLISRADRECELADAAPWDNKTDLADYYGRRAVRFYRDAARLSIDPARGQFYLRAVVVAENLGWRKAIVSLIREACRYEPDYETTEQLRTAWQGWAWISTRCGYCEEPAFPEPGRPGTRTLLDRAGPIPGQMELFR